MESETSQSKSSEGFAAFQRPEFRDSEILVAPAHVDLVEQELSELEPSLRFARREATPGIVRLEISAEPGRSFDVSAAIDRVRERCAAKFGGFRPVLSPVHIFTVGQPNVVGNPREAMPQNVEKGLGERTSGEGEGVTVAVIDTGIELHDWLNGAYLAMPADFERTVTVRREGKDVLGEQAGHGNFLAGLVLRQAPGATVKVVKTSDSNGRADVDAVAAAIARAAAAGADIVNLSLGCFTRHDNPPWTLVQALAELPGTTAVVASAGNSSTSRSFWPGALPRVTGVGALEEHDGGWRLTEWTNRGPWVDVYVPATDVLSTYIDYEGPAVVRADDGKLSHIEVRYGGWATWSGTSMAAATWSGALARTVSELRVSPAEAAHVLLTEPGEVSFARELELEPSERYEEGTKLHRRARDFTPASS
jgi:hypothetical protein